MRGGVVFNSGDLLAAILEFARKDEYLCFGTVNKALYHECDTKKTRTASCFKTVSRLRDSEIQFYNESSVHSHVVKCASVDVMRHVLHTGLVGNLNGALEHAIRSKNAELITALNTKFGETRVGPACSVAAVESGSLALV